MGVCACVTWGHSAVFCRGGVRGEREGRKSLRKVGKGEGQNRTAAKLVISAKYSTVLFGGGLLPLWPVAQHIINRPSAPSLRLPNPSPLHFQPTIRSNPRVPPLTPHRFLSCRQPPHLVTDILLPLYYPKSLLLSPPHPFCYPLAAAAAAARSKRWRGRRRRRR